VRFVYGAPAARIEQDGDRASGVRLQDGSSVRADLIVANADLQYVYRHLLPDARAAERLDRLEYTCSAFTFYWGVDKKYPELGTHNVFLASDYRASFDRTFTTTRCRMTRAFTSMLRRASIRRRQRRDATR